jgi:hypothetical protein
LFILPAKLSDARPHSQQAISPARRPTPNQSAYCKAKH